MRAAAERLRAAGVARPVPRLDLFNLLAASGVQLSDADNGHAGPGRRATFGSDDAREVVTWAQRMIDDKLVVADNSQSWSDDLLALGRGDGAMTFHGSYDLRDVSRALAQGQAPGFRLGVAPPPTLHGPARAQFTGGSFLLTNGPSLLRRGAAWTFWTGSRHRLSRPGGTSTRATSRPAALRWTTPRWRHCGPVSPTSPPGGGRSRPAPG